MFYWYPTIGQEALIENNEFCSIENLKEFWLKEPESIGSNIQHCSPHLTTSHLEIYSRAGQGWAGLVTLKYISCQAAGWELFHLIRDRKLPQCHRHSQEKYVYFSAKTNITQWDHWEANDAWYQTQLLIEIFQQINSHFLSPLSSIRSPEFSCCKVKSNYWLIRIKRLPRVDSSRGWWFVIILEEPERQLINLSVTIK